MAVVIKVTGAKELTRKLRGIAATINADLAKWVLHAALHVEGVVRGVVMRIFTKNPTGNLARSFKARMLTSGKGDIAAGVFSDSVYAEIHDKGGTIVPRTRKNLAIPISDRARTTRGLWPRHWPKGSLFAFRSKAGNLLLAERTRSGLRIHYALKPSVRIRARHYLALARKEATPGVTRILGDKVKLAIQRSA